jgi:uncharacterized protein YecE (DUF72 family)
MTNKEDSGPGEFQFRNFHPNVFMGTASDRYAGWMGQIYSKDLYPGKVTSRTKKVGGSAFKEDVLPVESVEEYFQHFSILELDFTFYQMLLNEGLKPTGGYQVLKRYQSYLREGDHLFLKAPQKIFARRLWEGGKFRENPDYLNAEVFLNRFYEPAKQLLGDSLKGFIFEQEYQPKKERMSSQDHAEGLEGFFRKIPKEEKYHIETRTGALLTKAYFDILEKYGVGQVLSHWTWLPPLSQQYKKGSAKFLNKGHQAILRLITPLRMRYDETYQKAHPFDKMIEGMMSHQMIGDAVEIMYEAIDQGVGINVIINNRAGGNAPIIGNMIKEAFEKTSPNSSLAWN